MDFGIFFAALGINLLELTEASAVGLALYADSHDTRAFLYVSLGVIAVYIPTLIVGRAISLLPVFLIRVIAATLLLYFGIRLARSARKSALRAIQMKNTGKQIIEERFEKSVMSTGISVGLVEAFEASIVLVALFPINFESAIYGTVLGIMVVILATYIMKSQVRKIKQAYMKVFVSSLLLTFSTFWYAESIINLNDLLIIPFFLFYFMVVYAFAYRKHSTCRSNL